MHEDHFLTSEKWKQPELTRKVRQLFDNRGHEFLHSHQTLTGWKIIQRSPARSQGDGRNLQEDGGVGTRLRSLTMEKFGNEWVVGVSKKKLLSVVRESEGAGAWFY